MKLSFNTQALPKSTFALIELFHSKKPSFLNFFYLSGGTGLALHLGHRQSEDLDFFTPQSFDLHQLLARLQNLSDQLDQVEMYKNTLNLYLNQVKLQFLTYPYPLLKPLTNWENIKISSVIDIACTKLITISQRGFKKDFVDLYFVLQRIPLEKLFSALEGKYKNVSFNKLHILKSLTFFNEADEQPMPKMLKPITWEQIRSELTIAVVKFRSHFLQD